MTRLNDMSLENDLIYTFEESRRYTYEDYDPIYGKRHTGSPDVPVWGSNKVVQRAGPTCLSSPQQCARGPEQLPPVLLDTT